MFDLQTNSQKYTRVSKKSILDRYEDLTISTYSDMLESMSLKKVWDNIIKLINNSSLKDINNSKIKFDDLGELYEYGLAETNKINKKEMGKYYTPKDVASVMAKLLLENEIDNLVDVAVGTGNLIIEVLIEMINSGYDIVDFIKSGRLWLYDKDQIAINIALAKINVLLNENLTSYINVVCADFLNKKITLPEGCSVITNPPYSLVKDLDNKWNDSVVMRESKDLYAGFMDKILDYAEHAVLVTPQSYLVAQKFSKLRKKLGENFYGEIFSFDNVPGTLFNGKKHGIFNTNTANGVRASITNIKRNGHNGFRLTHLIRFKTDQRKDVIDLDFMRSKLGMTEQDLKMPVKSFKELEPFVLAVLNNDHIYLEDIIEMNPKKYNDNYKLNVNSSARYFTVVSKRTLDRSGTFEIYAKSQDYYYLLYALTNSSYAYMWWRFIDGGILYSKRHLFKTPIMNSLLSKIDDIKSVVDEMISMEENYLSYKLNAGKEQESIKFPIKYRRKLNSILFEDNSKDFEMLHRNYEVI